MSKTAEANMESITSELGRAEEKMNTQSQEVEDLEANII